MKFPGTIEPAISWTNVFVWESAMDNKITIVNAARI